MSHTKVFSPQGEPFEVSSLNAHDLVTHAGWSYDQPTIVKAEVVENETAEEEEAGEDAADETSEEEEAGEDTSEEDAGGDAAPFTTTEQFDSLETLENVTAYLAQHFPDFKPHHLAKRDTLVAKAIELAAS